MTQQPNFSVRSLQSRKVLLRRLGCLGSLSLFSSGVAFAQVPSPVASPASKAVESTSAADLVIPAEPTPPAMTPAKPSPAEPSIAVETPASPAPTVSEKPVAKPQVSASPQAPAADYEAPASIVFSDRASGCQFAVKQGQAVAGACGKAPTVPQVSAKPTGIGNKISKAISSVIRPNFNTTTVSAVPEQTASVPQASWTPPTVVAPSEFVQNYYNRTVRPLGLPGNGDVRILFPLSIPSLISSAFGWRVHPITGDQRIHTGTDLAAPLGTPVLAALTGRVIMADFFGGYGLAVALEHTNGNQQTLYAHLSEIFVRPGDVIKQGTVIGRVGSTGNSTGPHLHFEFRQQAQDGTWVAQDAGFALEQAVAQLTRSLQVTQAAPQNTTAKAN